MAESEQYKALNLDIAQQQSFVRFFNNLPEKPSSTVRLFSRTDYYTTHADDAVLTANFFSYQLKYMGDKPKLSYVCLSKNNFEKFARELLLVKQYRIEVYVKPNQSKNNDWDVGYKGSPGNLAQFEELLFENVSIDFTNSVMGVKLCANKVLAICSVNLTETKMEVCEITDNESFSELETIIAQIGPKECLIPNGDSADLLCLKKILERNGILVAQVKKSDFSTQEIEQDLNRFLFFPEGQQRNCSIFTETKLKEAMSCLQAVLKFLNLSGDSRNFNQFKLSTLSASRFVRLDNAALFALNVLPKSRSQLTEGSAQKTSSLRGILENCVTPQGRRLLDQWIKQPLRDYNLINDRLDVVVTLVKDAEVRSLVLKECLPRVVDFLPLSKKLSCKRANLQDCFKIYQSISSLPHMVQTLENTRNKCVVAMLTDPLNGIMGDMQNYQIMIEQTLDLNLVDQGEYLIKASFDDELNDFNQRKQRIGEKMQSELSKVSADLGLEDSKGAKLECNEQNGYYFRVTLKEERALRQRKRYKIVSAVKGGVRFTSDKLEDLNEEYANINQEYKDRQKKVVEEIMEVASGYAELLKSLNNLVATVDVLTSFAVAAVAAPMPYVRPRLHKEGAGILTLKRARHPCLEAQESISFIPNNIAFNKEDKTMHIITGPNMCGKSTYIRSVGLCVLMAHIGSLVPCDEADISLVDGILVRIGADDCLSKGLSTFMLEMIETSSIMMSATQNSLVIIDELGRGTSTYDGCGIAWAIAEHLITNTKSFSLFATHYHEITRLADMFDNVGNLHVSAVTTEDTITPLYQVHEGECDKSYGIHCAKMVGFPDNVIKDAMDMQGKLEHSRGMKYITHLEPSVKRSVIKDGDLIIKETLKKLKATDFGKMSKEEKLQLIAKMKSDLLSEGNLFIKGLISQED